MMIGIVRPLLPKLETDEQTQRIFDLLIRSNKLHELMIIAAPVKESHPKLFPSLPPLNDLLGMVSETVLCKALVHYAAMIETASPHLLDAIFRISAFIVNKIANENNRRSLGLIYKFALNNLASSEGAVQLITVIAKRECTVATKSVYEFYDWDRSLEDVCRSLSRLIVEEDTTVTITDCATFGSVYNLLTCDVVPKILPFASHREMIEGMMRVMKAAGKKRQSFRRSSHGTVVKDALTGSRSNLQLCDTVGFDCKFEVLPKPQHLIMNDPVFHPQWEQSVVMSPEEFLVAVSSGAE
jgi:hypothetical protein